MLSTVASHQNVDGLQSAWGDAVCERIGVILFVKWVTLLATQPKRQST